MPPTPPGFYVYVAMNGRDKVACDLFGPFDSRQDVIEWMREHGVEYRENAKAYDRAVRYFGEMTADECESPWGTAIHARP